MIASTPPAIARWRLSFVPLLLLLSLLCQAQQIYASPHGQHIGTHLAYSRRFSLHPRQDKLASLPLSSKPLASNGSVDVTPSPDGASSLPSDACSTFEESGAADECPTLEDLQCECKKELFDEYMRYVSLQCDTKRQYAYSSDFYASVRRCAQCVPDLYAGVDLYLSATIDCKHHIYNAALTRVQRLTSCQI